LKRTLKDVNDSKKDVPLNITIIDKAKFSFFDQSDKANPIETVKSQKSQLQEFSKTTFVLEENKREKVMKFYKEELIKREVQKDMK
jgi:hypothetical protein